MLVNVDLKRDGNLTQMDDSLLERHEGVERVYNGAGELLRTETWTQYLLDGREVHRSAGVEITVAGMPPMMTTAVGSLACG